MSPWCADGDVPTAANLNLYGGSKSHVAWHCDDEPLFGGNGDPKLIVSLSLGSSATFKWKAKSCSDSEASSCRLHHGDLLVMDGRCQDEYLHCTSPGLAERRVNITYRWIRYHTPKCPLAAGVCWDPCLPVRRVHPPWDLSWGTPLLRPCCFSLRGSGGIDLWIAHCAFMPSFAQIISWKAHSSISLSSVPSGQIRGDWMGAFPLLNSWENLAGQGEGIYLVIRNKGEFMFALYASLFWECSIPMAMMHAR